MDVGERVLARLALGLQITVIFAGTLVLGWGVALQSLVGGAMAALMTLYIFALRKKRHAFNSNIGLNALGAVAGVVGFIALLQ